VIWIGLLMGLVSLALGYVFWREGDAVWQTIVFSTLTFSQMFLVLAIRSERDSVFTTGLLSNRANLAAVLLTFVLQLAVVYVPIVQSVFKTVPMSPSVLALSLAISSISLWAVEIQKWLGRRKARTSMG
jgi:P-type Ca2+ transporter type 2C